MASTTLISSLTWIPRGRAAQHPTKYEFNENELERVGKMGGEGVLERLREEMEGMEVEDRKVLMEDGENGDDGDWEDESNPDDNPNGSSSSSSSGESIKDVTDGEDGTTSQTKSSKKQKRKATVEEEVDGMQVDGEGKGDDLTAYNLEAYDEEESRGTAMGAFSNIKGLRVYQDNNDDPYITLKDDASDTSDRSDLEILPTDSLLLTARTSEDLSSLEYHVYDEEAENLYVHHDLMLPSFPVCVEWLDFPPGPSESSGNANAEGGVQRKTHGNYIAVGTFDPSVEVWDMDLLDGLYPEAILGPAASTSSAADPRNQPKAKGTGKKKRRLLETSKDHHVSSVTSLSWTPSHRNLLLSGSADTTIKLWDLTRESPQSAIRSWDNVHGNEKVLGVEWNKSREGGNETVVLSAGERTVKVWDSRTVGDGVGTGGVGSDVETVRWDPWSAMDFFVSLENGLILCYDARTLSTSTSLKSAAPKPKYTISAHDGPASAMDVSPHVKGCIATGGMDRVVKVWNVEEEEGGKRAVSLVTSRDLGVGKVFTVRFSPDSPLTLAAAGSSAKLQIWDVSTNAGARQAFGGRLRAHGRELAEARKGRSGLVGIVDEEEDSEEE